MKLGETVIYPGIEGLPLCERVPKLPTCTQWLCEKAGSEASTGYIFPWDTLTTLINAR